MRIAWTGLPDPLLPVSSSAKWSVLSLVRFILALTVVTSHLGFFQSPRYFYDEVYGNLAHASVFGFFIISGFSISQSFRKRREGFYRRRVLRIYPLYLASVLAGAVVGLALGPEIHLEKQIWYVGGWGMVAGNILLLQGFICRSLSTDPVLWSLSIEAFFYLLTPAFHRLPNRVLEILILFSLACYIHWIPIPSEQYGFNALIHLWPWLLGFVLDRSVRREKWLVFGIGIVAGFFYLQFKHMEKWRSILPYFIALAMVAWMNFGVLSKKWQNLFNWLGDISYPLYLFHLPVMIVCYLVFQISGTVPLIFLVLAVSGFVYWTVDVVLRGMVRTPFRMGSMYLRDLWRARRA